MGKKIGLVLIIAICIWSMQATVAASPPKVFLDGRELYFDVPPLIQDGRVMVPLRTIFEALGAEVTWDPSANQAKAEKDQTNVIIPIGSETPTVNGQIFELDVPATYLNGRILAPLRFAGEAFGCAVFWNPSTNGINLVSNRGQYVQTFQVTLSLSHGQKTGYYTGPLSNGNPNGYGEFRLIDDDDQGWTYHGDFVDGHLAGDGEISFVNGDRQTGIFANDQLVNGQYYREGLLVYEGNWLDGLYNGHGKLYYKNKLIFAGEFENGWPEKSSFQAWCTSIAYEDLYSRPERYIGDAIKSSGRVIRVVLEKGEPIGALISLDDNNSQFLYAVFSHENIDAQVLPGHKIKVWGWFEGPSRIDTGSNRALEISALYLDVK